MNYGKDRRWHLQSSKNVPRGKREEARIGAAELWREQLLSGSIIQETTAHRAHSPRTLAQGERLTIGDILTRPLVDLIEEEK